MRTARRNLCLQYQAAVPGSHEGTYMPSGLCQLGLPGQVPEEPLCL